MFLLMSIAALMALGATMATGAETRETYSPICGMPLAVFDGPSTGILARTAKGPAANICCDRLGPMMATTLRHVDLVLVGVDGGGLVAAGVLEDQLERTAVHAALLVEVLLGDLRTQDLLLAGQGHRARLGHRHTDRDRVGRVAHRGAADQGHERGNQNGRHEATAHQNVLLAGVNAAARDNPLPWPRVARQSSTRATPHADTGR